MSGIRKTIDARGLACPEPVIRVKKAFEEGGFELLEILVGDQAARDNVRRFVEYSGGTVVSMEALDKGARFIVAPKGVAAAQDGGRSPLGVQPREEASTPPEAKAAARATVFIAGETIGRGEAELGALLMKGFIYALAEAAVPPARIIFMNAGVKLAIEGSEHLGNLGRLAEAGVEILACGTCLDYYGLKEKLAVGRVSNMYEIAGCLLEGPTLSM